MADYFIESDSLIAIADKIREQLDESDIIYPGDMPEKIHTDLGNVKAIIGRTITELKHTGVEIIADYAFYSYPSLTTVNFPKCITIGANAFHTCTDLTTTYFPACTSVGTNAFAGCTNITNAALGFTTITSTTFPFKAAAAKLTNLTLTNCTTIKASAFNTYTNLLSLYLPTSDVVSLANTNAFDGTPISTKTISATSGKYGLIYVPESLVTTYKQTANWAAYSERITFIP